MTKPIRQCICCKGRFIQKDLNRFLCIEGELYRFSHNKGRSIYICTPCIEQKSKRLLKSLNRYCKKNYDNIDKFFENIRSI